jgi:hypothetical protein
MSEKSQIAVGTDAGISVKNFAASGDGHDVGAAHRRVKLSHLDGMKTLSLQAGLDRADRTGAWELLQPLMEVDRNDHANWNLANLELEGDKCSVSCRVRARR